MEREVSEVDRKLLIKKNYLDKIRYHLTRNPIDQDELYSMVKKFFSEYLKLDYEFTYEELSQELNKVFIKPKVKEHIDMFLIRLSESEYLAETHLGSGEINAYLTEFDEIIRNVIFDDQPVIGESPTLIQKVLKRKSAEQSNSVDRSSASALIDEINYHITNRNIETAKSSYVELSNLYDKLNKDDKKKVHDDMNEVYERLQTLIKNPGSLNNKQNSDKSNNRQNDAENSFSDTIKNVMTLIDETSFYLNSYNADSAKKSYVATLKAYDALNPEERKSLHSKVNDLYNKLQDLSSGKFKSVDSASNNSDSSIPLNENVLSEDLPELEPITKQTRSQNQENNGSETVVPPIVTVNSLPISTASFVEDFGKAVASSGNASVIDVAKNSNVNTNTNVKFDFAAPIDNNNIIENEFQANGPVTDEIDLDQLAPSSNAPNMLFTASDKSINVPLEKNMDKSPVKGRYNDEIKEKEKLPETDFNKDKQPGSMIKPQDQKSQEKSQPLTSFETSSQTANIYDSKTSNTDVRSDSTVIFTKERISTISKAVPKIPDSIPEILETKSTNYLASNNISNTILKLDSVLKKIDDDIIMDKLDKGKESYKDALIIYRSLRDSDKVICYERFFNTFKKLDDALHKKSLHTILEEQLLDSKSSNRPLVTTPYEQSEQHLPESSILNNSLPVALNNDLETTRVYELIEESYFNIDNNNSDLAMLKYFKAVEYYRKLSSADKRKVYIDLYALLQRLSVTKKVSYY